ncbi:hypothetical protein H0H93_006690 [Arthromyces matolae]|nr:hypothetical protein H0H93_006690 [Arthromyces matolae]
MLDSAARFHPDMVTVLFTTMPKQLPAEIKSEIVGHCPPNTLYTFALVSKAFQYEAERELYSTISIHSDNMPGLQNVFETLTKREHKARFVRYLKLEVYEEIEMVMRELFSTLPKLKALIDLRLWVAGRDKDVHLDPLWALLR